MSLKNAPLNPEWSYPVAVEDIPSTGLRLTLAPKAEEKEAIAERLGILTLGALSADLELSREKGGHVIHVVGRFTADITQECVVSLEPVTSHIDDAFDAWFADHSQVIPFAKAQHEMLSKKEMVDLPMLEEEEDPEPIVDGKIDLGEVVVQYLSLAVNPYPHKDGVDYENNWGGPTKLAATGSGGPRLSANPFAALKNWRPND